MHARITATGSRRAAWAAALFGVLALAGPLPAQTDFYNLDHGRPLRVEDAYATERYAFELKVAPLSLAGARGGDLVYTPAVELKHGLQPGLELSAGASPVVRRADGGTDLSPGALELSALLNLNTETLALPALGIRLSTHLPLEADHGPAAEVKGILTRTLGGPVRAHLNGAALLGEGREADWWAGAALDYVLPFHSTLLLVETYATRPRGDGADLRIDSAAGLRHQITPGLGIDAGVGRSWSGPEGDRWRLTLGVTGTLGVRRLMPIR